MLMSVYSRTEIGQDAANGEQSALPRKLKSLLGMIDGKTASHVYVRNLHAFGDVEKILSSLEIAGLLHHSTKSAFSASLPTKKLATRSKWRKLLSFRLAEENSKINDDPDTALAEPEAFSEFSETQVLNFNEMSQINQDAAVKQATGEMAEFVLSYAPEHAVIVLKELEEISSSEQLAIAMSGYAQLIAHCGDPGSKHLVKIKQLVRNSF